MIGIEIRFLAGRFHANAWHNAHNEGVAEWPPSPWRVLRALVSAAYALEAPLDRVEALLEKLRGLPRYRLPQAVDAHTRHYMPDVDDSQHTRAKVFDSFVAVEGGASEPRPVLIAWETELTQDERALLAALARRIGYLGRAESWADLSVVDVGDGPWDCWADDAPAAAGTTLLALDDPHAFATWAALQPAKAKGRDVPRTLWDVLTFDGERFRKEGWSEVPGTRRVRFAFAGPPFQRAVVPRRIPQRMPAPTIARYAIRSSVLPRLHEALSVGERLRVAAMSKSKAILGDASTVFSGHGEAATMHQHAMYLSTGTEGFIEHVVIAARMGFGRADVRALQSLRRVWGRDGHDLELVLVNLWDEVPSDAAPPALATSTDWESVTPFVPTRHPKRNSDGIADQIRRGCVQLLGISPTDVEPFGEVQDWARFRRMRRDGGGRRGPNRPYGARLRFARPVTGPIAIGYGSHFGLGLFEATGS